MLPAMVVDMIAQNDDWRSFAISFAIGLFIGSALFLSTRRGRQSLSTRQAMVLTTLSWLALSLIGALPFYISGITETYTDAFFETMSGITTTGATVLTDLDNAPPGLLFWRSTLQWLGGLGIIVMAVAVLPMLQIGGMQVFRAEAFDTAEKILPRATQISSSLIGVFSLFTVICALAYVVAGLSPFEAINHAMTTVATGGFSTRDASISAFENGYVEWVGIVFMLVGSLPFLAYIQFLQGKRNSLVIDSQIRAFFWLIITLAVIVIMISQATALDEATTPARTALFNMISIVTGTGYASADYGSWGTSSVAFFFIIMFIGGCAGSTSCGIKIFRFQLLFREVKRHANEVLYPNGVFVLRYNGRKLDRAIAQSVISFFILYIISFLSLALMLRLTGLDFLTALSGAGTAISNVGPGLGEIIGPTGNYASLSDAAKWILCFGMLLGRLEIFAILTLLLPQFWRN